MSTARLTSNKSKGATAAPEGQVVPIRNMFFPLSFELMGPGKEADMEALETDFPELSQELRSLEPYDVYDFEEEIEACRKHPKAWAHPKAMEAFTIAIKAWRLSGEEARAEAERALEVCELCPEAYNVLGARASSTFAEALEYFKKAEELGPKVVKDGQRLINEATWSRVGVFAMTPLRSLFRAVLGVAATLKKMGRYLEAIEKFRYLSFSLDSQIIWPTTSSYIEYRAQIPELYIRTRRAADAVRYITEGGVFMAECAYLNPALGLAWKMSLALAYYMLWTENPLDEGGAGYPSRAARARAETLAGKDKTHYMLLVESGLMAHEAVLEFAYCVDWLTGRYGTRPTIQAPAIIGDMFSHSHALAYCHSSMDLWQAVPGALTWLRKMLNTAWILQYCRETPVCGDGLPDYRDEEAFRRRVSDPDGFFYKEPINTNGQTLVQAVCMSNKTRIEGWSLKLIIQHAPGIDLDLEDKQGLRPMNVLCYYDLPPSVLQALLECGARVVLEPWQNSPLAMAANQGNYRALLALLEGRPDLCTTEVLGDCADAMFDSSCYACVRGGPKCQRCTNEDRPHSAYVSFERCIDVLVSKGLTDLHLVRCPKQGSTSMLHSSFLHRIRMATATVDDTNARCLACWRASPASSLKCCSRCRRAAYCGPECQRANWHEHRSMCFPAPTLHDEPPPPPPKLSPQAPPPPAPSKPPPPVSAMATHACTGHTCCGGGGGGGGRGSLKTQPKALGGKVDEVADDVYLSRVLGRAGLANPNSRKTQRKEGQKRCTFKETLEYFEKALRGVKLDDDEPEVVEKAPAAAAASKPNQVESVSRAGGDDDWLAGTSAAQILGGGKKGGGKKKNKKGKGKGRRRKAAAAESRASGEEGPEDGEEDDSEDEEAPPLEEVGPDEEDYVPVQQLVA